MHIIVIIMLSKEHDIIIVCHGRCRRPTLHPVIPRPTIPIMSLFVSLWSQDARTGAEDQARGCLVSQKRHAERGTDSSTCSWGIPSFPCRNNCGQNGLHSSLGLPLSDSGLTWTICMPTTAWDWGGMAWPSSLTSGTSLPSCTSSLMPAPWLGPRMYSYSSMLSCSRRPRSAPNDKQKTVELCRQLSVVFSQEVGILFNYNIISWPLGLNRPNCRYTNMLLLIGHYWRSGQKCKWRGA